MMQGYKTYLVAGAAVVWAIYGVVAGLIDGVAATNVILAALGAAGLRNAVK